MYTIGQLVKQFDLSRSTLLYYDKIDLLKPSGRSAANYRLYTNADLDRMSEIALYKEAGLPLDAIAEILESTGGRLEAILRQRLESLNAEMSDIRRQQQLVLQLLGKDSLLSTSKVMTKKQWIRILEASGMDDNAMLQWHVAFERDLPEAHSDFLESLGMSEEEIADIKERSRLEASEDC